MNFVINHDPETTPMKTAACPKSNTLLIILRIIMLVAAALLALLALGGCVTVNHTLEDGTRISANSERVSVTSGKSTVEFELPRK